jgi:predicted HicB family RNase H-like nuclease
MKKMPKKPSKKEPAKSFTMRLPNDVRDKVAAAAAEMGESESLVIRQALREYFLAREAAKSALAVESPPRNSTPHQSK